MFYFVTPFTRKIIITVAMVTERYADGIDGNVIFII